MRPHTSLRDHVRNDNIRDRLAVENITERYIRESKIGVVWTREETRPIIRRNK